MINKHHVDVFNQCDLTEAGIERQYGIPASNLRRWLWYSVTPSKKYEQQIEEVFMRLESRKRIPYHPSWGYATKEQIDRLKESISPMEREAILKQIEKQTRNRGKID